MTVFDDAATALFDDSNLGEAATYTPQGGSAVAVTVVLARPDKRLDLGVAGINVPSWTADIRVSELPSGARKGDTLDVGADSFIVRRIEREALRIVARLDLDKV